VTPTEELAGLLRFAAEKEPEKLVISDFLKSLRDDLSACYPETGTWKTLLSMPRKLYPVIRPNLPPAPNAAAWRSHKKTLAMRTANAKGKAQ